MRIIQVNLLRRRVNKYQLVDWVEDSYSQTESQIQQLIASSQKTKFATEEFISKLNSRCADNWLKFEKIINKYEKAVIDRETANRKATAKFQRAPQKSDAALEKVLQKAIAAKKSKIELTTVMISARLSAIESIIFCDGQLEVWKLKVLKKLFICAQEDFGYLQQEFQKAIVAEQRLCTQYQQAKYQVKQWQHRARIALQKGDEKLARESLCIKKYYTERAIAIAAFLDEPNPFIEELSQKLNELKNQMTELGIPTNKPNKIVRSPAPDRVDSPPSYYGSMYLLDLNLLADRFPECRQ